ncbi:hypothetical protein N9N67_11740, partial [Bacteriovoracaceae bacterium]|nr:hypothetical protein [Bacteriovoracaceae bacterium]
MILARKHFFLFLTSCLFCFPVSKIYSQTSTQPLFEEIKLKTHLRLKFNLPKDQLLIRKKDSKLTIQTLNIDLFNKLVGMIEKTPLQGKYFTSRFYDTKNYPNVPASIVLNLKNKNIETFSFFKSESNNHIVDLWDNDSGSRSSSAQKAGSSSKPLPKVVKKAITPKSILKIKPKSLAGSTPTKLNAKKTKLISKKKVIVKKTKKSQLKRRDFRYGAAFIWNYPAIFEDISNDFSIPAKSIDYLYSVK